MATTDSSSNSEVRCQASNPFSKDAINRWAWVRICRRGLLKVPIVKYTYVSALYYVLRVDTRYHVRITADMYIYVRVLIEIHRYQPLYWHYLLICTRIYDVYVWSSHWTVLNHRYYTYMYCCMTCTAVFIIYTRYRLICSCSQNVLHSQIPVPCLLYTSDAADE